MNLASKRALGAVVSAALACGGLALVAAPASASTDCNFVAAQDFTNNYGAKAASWVDVGSFCSAQNTRAKDNSGTYTAWGTGFFLDGANWKAYSPVVPSGRNVVGSQTRWPVYGVTQFVYATH